MEYCALDFFLRHGSLFILLHGMPSLKNKKAEKFNFTHKAHRVMWRHVGSITPAGQCYTQFSRELALLPLQRHEEVCRGESLWVMSHTYSMGHFVVHLLHIFTPLHTVYYVKMYCFLCHSHTVVVPLVVGCGYISWLHIKTLSLCHSFTITELSMVMSSWPCCIILVMTFWACLVAQSRLFWY